MYGYESDYSMFTVGEYEDEVAYSLQDRREIANFARTRRRSSTASTATSRRGIPPSKFRPSSSSAPIDPFAATTKKGNIRGSGIVQATSKTGKKFIRRAKAGARLGRMKAKKAISPGIKAGGQNIAYGGRQVVGDVTQGTMNVGRGALSKARGLPVAGKAAAVLGVGAAGYGGYRFLTRKKRRRG